MPNYIITYTINDDNVRDTISDFINGLGLHKESNKFTRYGLYSNNKETLVKILVAAKTKYKVDKNDTIILYYADLNRNNYSTINEVKI